LCGSDAALRAFHYRQWIHEHTFEARDGGTLARDHVPYAVAQDFLVHRLFVRPDMDRIFQYRSKALRKRFPSPERTRA
jgi:ligand-binding SRPBCC domain-containing protein